MRTPDRGSTTGAASWTDCEPASGLPRRGERSESIPPLTAIFEMRACTQVRAFFSHVAPAGGMRTPDRGSTTGAASWTDREPASGLPRRGERSESIPPPHRHILRRARTQVRAFFFACGTHRGGMRTPDRGSTTGNASWTDREPASGLPRQKRRERF